MTVSSPRKNVPGMSQAKGTTAGRKVRPKAIEMRGPATSGAIDTAGSINAAVASTALFASRNFTCLSVIPDNLGNNRSPTTTGNIIVFSASTWLIE